ncbi:hypothetical protein CXF71_18750 [Colwellia sp. 12G3]|nr:hypothetical protein CXF71_18750 [Colwellia sp. 12G3]
MQFGGTGSRYFPSELLYSSNSLYIFSPFFITFTFHERMTLVTYFFIPRLFQYFLWDIGISKKLSEKENTYNAKIFNELLFRGFEYHLW